MRIARVFAVVIAAVCVVAILAPTVSAQQLMERANEATAPGRVTVSYNPVDGYVDVHTNNSVGDGLTTAVIEFRVNQAPTDVRFNPAEIEWSKGLFDVSTAVKMASINPDGVGRGTENPWTVGKVLPPGLGYDDLLSVLFISGSHSNGGNLSKHGLAPALFIPEPSTLVLFGLGLLGLVGLRRRS